MTNNKQQTAVEWLIKEYNLPIDSPLVQQAKEMEKEQMIDFALECQEMFKHQIIEKFNENYGK